MGYICPYRSNSYSEVQIKICVISILLLLNVFSVPTIAVNVTTDGMQRVFQN